MRERLLGSVKKHEGFRPRVYLDHLGNPTIGYGTRVNEIELDEQTAEMWLLNELLEKRERLCSVMGFEVLSEVRQDVILEMAYQMGVGGVLRFKRMWAAIHAGRWDEAADEMLDSRWHREQTPERAWLLSQRMRTNHWED